MKAILRHAPRQLTGDEVKRVLEVLEDGRSYRGVGRRSGQRRSTAFARASVARVPRHLVAADVPVGVEVAGRVVADAELGMRAQRAHVRRCQSNWMRADVITERLPPRDSHGRFRNFNGDLDPAAATWHVEDVVAATGWSGVAVVHALEHGVLPGVLFDVMDGWRCVPSQIGMAWRGLLPLCSCVPAWPPARHALPLLTDSSWAWSGPALAASAAALDGESWAKQEVPTASKLHEGT